LRQSIDPVAIVAISIFVEESSTAMFLVFKPVACVFTAELGLFQAPVSTLTMALVYGPHTFILVTVLIVLNTETFLAVIAPVADVTRR